MFKKGNIVIDFLKSLKLAISLKSLTLDNFVIP